MRRKIILWSIALFLSTVAAPFFAVSLASYAGMAICLILFFAVDPILAVIGGLLAGNNIKKLWMLVMVSPIAFILGTWLFLDLGELAFLIYSGIYLLLGIISMLLYSLVKHTRQ